MWKDEVWEAEGFQVVKQSATKHCTNYDTMLYLINRINMLLWAFAQGSECEKDSNFKTAALYKPFSSVFNQDLVKLRNKTQKGLLQIFTIKSTSNNFTIKVGGKQEQIKKQEGFRHKKQAVFHLRCFCNTLLFIHHSGAKINFSGHFVLSYVVSGLSCKGPVKFLCELPCISTEGQGSSADGASQRVLYKKRQSHTLSWSQNSILITLKGLPRIFPP